MRIAVSLLFFLASTLAPAQDGLSYLVRGPHAGVGLFFLSPNALDHAFGEYRHEETLIGVYFTRERIVPGADWLEDQCGATDGALLPWGESAILYVKGDLDWARFFDFPKDYGNPCGFIDLFLRRFRYFIGVTDEQSGIPLPAILQFTPPR